MTKVLCFINFDQIILRIKANIIRITYRYYKLIVVSHGLYNLAGTPI